MKKGIFFLVIGILFAVADGTLLFIGDSLISQNSSIGWVTIAFGTVCMCISYRCKALFQIYVNKRGSVISSKKVFCISFVGNILTFTALRML